MLYLIFKAFKAIAIPVVKITLKYFPSFDIYLLQSTSKLTSNSLNGIYSFKFFFAISVIIPVDIGQLILIIFSILFSLLLLLLFFSVINSEILCLTSGSYFNLKSELIVNSFI